MEDTQPVNSLLKKQIEIKFGDAKFLLRHDGTALLPEAKTLLVTDLHLGKETSFRARSIPVPEGPTNTTLELLTQSLKDTCPAHLVILGDLIHDANSLDGGLVERFSRWREQHQRVNVTLVRGNHDRYIRQFPTNWNLNETSELCCNDLCSELSSTTISLVHETPSNENHNLVEEQFYVQGHWHPVVNIGRGADQIRVRSFIRTEFKLILPAFGPFKGGKVINKRSAAVFPIIEGFILSGS